MKKYQVVVKAESADTALALLIEKGLLHDGEPPKKIIDNEFVLVVNQPLDSDVTMKKLIRWYAIDEFGGGSLPMGSLLFWSELPAPSPIRSDGYKSYFLEKVIPSDK